MGHQQEHHWAVWDRDYSTPNGEANGGISGDPLSFGAIATGKDHR